MKKFLIIGCVIAAVACSVSKSGFYQGVKIPKGTYEDSLRFFYSFSPNKWPKPTIDSGVNWQELGPLPDNPYSPFKDTSLMPMYNLGKQLFFDPRLSGSGQISCASCHVPDLSWTDGREVSNGHDMQLNSRNSPSLLNVWHAKKLFWDGRSTSLEDQASTPISTDNEMHSSMPEMLGKLQRIEGYKPLFQKAFGADAITGETVTKAIAAFERSISSRRSDFDRFAGGDTAALSNAALRGLHLFRTKARCMNCHNGAYFTDDSMHNIGLTYYGNKAHEDLGLYLITKRAADVGKFKTPMLRDVMRTRPWMHNGLFDNIEGVLNMYSNGMPQPKRKPGQEKDTLFPKTDPLLKKLGLTKDEKADIIAFLNAITDEPLKVRAPKPVSSNL